MPLLDVPPKHYVRCLQRFHILYLCYTFNSKDYLIFLSDFFLDLHLILQFMGLISKNLGNILIILMGSLIIIYPQKHNLNELNSVQFV